MEIDKSLAASTTTLVPSNVIDTSTTSTPVANLAQTTIVVTSSASLSIATQNMVNGLPPLPVGREFVRQFYTMMGKSPKNLYRFYSANSTLTYGNNAILIGQDKIRKDIESRELRNCHAYIIKIDSQPTLGNGVVVQVIGELSNNDEPLRPFTQTFVLSLHIPKNFYVHNEIFRYQDELYPEINLEALKLPIPENHHVTTTTGADQVAPDISTSWLLPPSEPSVAMKAKIFSMNQIECASLEPVVFANDKNQSKNNISSIGMQASSMPENVHEKLQIEKPIEWTPETPLQTIIEAHAHTDMQISSAIQENQIPLVSINPIEYNATKSKNDDQARLMQKTEKLQNENKSQAQADENSKTQAVDPSSNTPMTYANVFKSASGLLRQPQNLEPPIPSKNDIKPIFIRSAIFTASTSSFVPAANESPAASKPTIADNKPAKKDRVTDGPQNCTTIGPKTVGNNENNVVKSASFHQQRRSRQRHERYDEGLQLFLGNLPVGATAEALTKIFERYGTILELRVLSKAVQAGMRKLPNYGFLTYDCTEAVHRCLEDVPFYFPENTRNGVRLNVRPKNKDENLSARSIKSPTCNDNAGECGKRMGYISERKETDRRFEKRGRTLNFQENDQNSRSIARKEETNDVRNSIVPAKTEDQKSLLMEDWPPIVGPSSEGGGGNSGGMRRKKDLK